MFAWEAATGKPLVPPEPYDHIEFSPDGRRVLTALRLTSTMRRVLGRPGARPTKAPRCGTSRRASTGPPLTLGRDIHREDLQSGRLPSPGERVQPGPGLGRGQRAAVARTCGVRRQFTDGVQPRRDALPETVRQKNVNVWDAATGRPLVTLPLADRPTQAHFTPDGYCILTATTSSHSSGDASTGEAVSPPLQHSDSFSEAPVQVNRDGSLVFTRIGGEGEQAQVLEPFSRSSAAGGALAELAQLLSGHRLDDLGQRVPLQPAEVEQLWQQLRAVPETFGLQTVEQGTRPRSATAWKVTAALFHAWSGCQPAKGSWPPPLLLDAQS